MDDRVGDFAPAHDDGLVLPDHPSRDLRVVNLHQGAPALHLEQVIRGLGRLHVVTRQRGSHHGDDKLGRVVHLDPEPLPRSVSHVPQPGGEDLGPIDELPVAPTHFGLDVPEDVPFRRGEHDRLPIFVIAQSGDEFSDALRGGGRAVVGSPREGRDGTCEHRALNCEECVESRKN